MGLAASQARLLTLTSRSIDLELKCMRFSNQQIRNAQKACELSEDYNTKLDWLQDRYDASQKAQADAANGGEMVSLNTISFAKLNSYGITVSTPAAVKSGNTDSNGSFDKSSINFASHIKLVAGQTFPSATSYADAVKSFLNTYGNDSFTLNKSNSRSIDYGKALGIGERAFFGIINAYNAAVSNPSQYSDPGRAITLTIEKLNQYGIDPREDKNKFLSDAAKLASVWWAVDTNHQPDDELKVNNKFVTKSAWDAALNSAAASSGMNATAFKEAARNGGVITNERIEQLSAQYTVDYIDDKTFTGYAAAESAASANFKDSPEYKQYLNNLNAPKVSEEESNAALADIYEHPEKLWDYVNQGLLVLVGPNGVITDPQSYSVEKENDAPIDIYDKDQLKSDKERLEREYDNDTKRLSLEDKKIQAQLTQVQTELNACNSEIQSVKTLIDKNVERGFSYGYNA